MDFVYEHYKNIDLSLLNKLTLVIPTYNRNYYLSRCLWYHAHFPFGEIIVADSSPEEKKVVNRETVGNVMEMFGANVKYLEYEPETEKYGGDIHKKWCDAIQHVKTEYSQSCTDKEFLIPNTSCKCIDFLDKNSDFSVAEGMDYIISNNFMRKFKIIPNQGHKSLDSENVLNRLNNYINYKYTIGTQFGVYKSTIHKKIYSNLNKYSILDIKFGETAIEIQPIIYGKTMKFQEVSNNYRDTTKTHGNSLLKINMNESESSFIRYPVLDNYQPNHYESLISNLSICIQSEIYNACNIDLKYNDIMELTKLIIIKRYSRRKYRNDILNDHKLLQILWENIPIRLKQIISEKYGCGIVEVNIQKSKITPELRCILNIIKSTSKYYESDSPIVNVNRVR